MALSYMAPAPDFNIDAFVELTKQFGGEELFGYWPFFADENAPRLIESHVCAFKWFHESIV